MSNQYGWKILLDGADITDKTVSFIIESSLDSYCRELSLDILDETLYDSLIFSSIPETARIEVLTRVTDDIDEYDEYSDYDWNSQGLFFIERPTFRVGVDQTDTGIWGRQSTAVLGEPFAQKVTKIWSEDTTFYEICKELIESVGLVWDSSKCELQDFAIYADNFEADDKYPIEVIRDLIDFIVGEEGFITTDRLGNIWIRRISRSPTASDYDLTDLVVQSINEEPVWPEFGNRIKILPAEMVSQDTIDLFVERSCLGENSSTFIEMYAQVKDGLGVPITNAAVRWWFDPPIPESLWYLYPTIYQKEGTVNTSRMLISKELQRATGKNSIDCNFEVAELIGIWAYADKSRTTNFAPEGSYTIDGRTIYLTGDGFTYSDQTVFVSYYADGMCKNVAIYDEDQTEPEGVESLFGSAVVIASVSGREASQLIYVNNDGKCPPELSVEVSYPGSVTTASTLAEQMGQEAEFTPGIVFPSTGLLGRVPVGGTVIVTAGTDAQKLLYSSKVSASLIWNIADAGSPVTADLGTDVGAGIVGWQATIYGRVAGTATLELRWIRGEGVTATLLDTLTITVY
jgi:hypothetical protein